MKIRFAAMVVVALFAGCGGTSTSRIDNKLVDRPPAYREGYQSGCSYGRAEAGNTANDGSRDENRIRSDSSYANGWYDGLEYCRDNYQATPADRRHDPTKPVRSEGGW